MNQSKNMAAVMPVPEPAQVEGEGRKKILLVEGDGFTRLVLLLRLRLAGFGVEFTSNGNLGLTKLRTCHPDILLLELKLCGLSGLELVRTARSQPTFGDRPIFVFTHAGKLSRHVRKELDQLAVKVLDKDSVTREDLVQIFSSTFAEPEAVTPESPVSGVTQPAVEPAVLSEVVVSGAIDELIAGVREQTELFIQERAPRAATGGELLSRISSLASCANAARLADLARHVKALENFVAQLCQHQSGCSDTELQTLSRAVEITKQISKPGRPQAQNLTRFAVLFVDESPYSNRAMEEALLKAGFNPVCFEDPSRAREALGLNRTDLILANLALPEAHGLSLAEIRSLPLHDRTPVIFAPESLGSIPHANEVPGSAPRLDRAPLLLTELVVKALNEVQGKGTSEPAQKPATSSAPVICGPANAAAANSLADDSFELIARAPRRQSTPAAAAPMPAGSAQVGPVQNAAAFSHLFTASGIPSEPIMRSEPSLNSEDHTAKSVPVIAETPVEFSQAELQALEAVAPAAFQPVAAPVEPEQTLQDPTVAASEAEQGTQPLPGHENVNPEQDPIQIPGTDSAHLDSHAMNNRFQAPADWPQAGHPLQQDSAQAGAGPAPADLAARVCAAEMSLYHAQAELEERNKTIEALQKQLLAGNAASGDQGAEGQPKLQARCAELEQEIAALRQALEGLNGGLAEGAAHPDSKPEDPALKARAAELEKLHDEQKAREADLHKQLEAARGQEKENGAARAQAEARCAELEQQLNKLRETAAANPPAASGEPKPSASGREAVADGDAEQQIRVGVAALAKATAELARERGERQRCQQLVCELNSRLLALHQDCTRTLQAQGENLARITTLEQEHAQAAQALEKCQADLEQHQAERELAEAQLQKSKDLNAQLRKDLSFFQETHATGDRVRQDLQKRMESNLNAAREQETKLQQSQAERQRLADELEQARRELSASGRQRDALEKELQSTRELLKEREAKLEKETAELRQLNEHRDFAQADPNSGPERELEFSKLQSALQNEQVERKRQESELARTRQKALDAAQAARALRTSLRRQIREPVENLVHSAQNLLELEMGEEQKKLAEAVLQDVLLVQTRLREPAANPTENLDSAKTS